MCTDFDRQYDAERIYILKGSDQNYHFHTSIMSANRRIYEESVNLFQRENNIICLTSSRSPRLAHYFNRREMKMILSGAKAHRFSYAAMTLTVDDPVSDLQFYGWSLPADEQPCKYIFCSDELPTFCRLLIKHPGRFEKGQSLPNIEIHIDVHNAGRDHSWNMDRSTSGLSRLHKLVDPLRQLHSLGAVQIEGPLSASYKSSVIADLCEKCPTAMEIIGSANVILGQGDEQVRQDLPVDAINKYKTALNHLRSCCWLYLERAFVMDSGPFPGLTAERILYNLKVRLLARIASTYFQIRMLRMARIYVERALNPHHSLDEESHRLYRLEDRPWQQVVYAEVLNVSAHIWYAYGHVGEAIGDLRNAQEYMELNEGQECTLEAWQKHEDKIYERRTKKRDAREIMAQKSWLRKRD